MSMFGARSPFLPVLQAAMAGQIAGSISEGQHPRAMAQAVGAPTPPPMSSQGPMMNRPGVPSQAMGLPPSSMAMPRGAPGMFAGQPPQPEGLNTQPLVSGQQSIGALPDVAAQFTKTHKGLFPGKDWKTIVPMIADALLAANASHNPASMAMLQNSMAMRRERQ